MPKHPFHSEPTNQTRKNLARLALAAYLQAKGEMPDNDHSDIVDLITDLMHLAGTERVAETALIHYSAEA